MDNSKSERVGGGNWIGWPRGLAAALLLFSGFSALVYQVVWQKMLGLVFGDTTIATTAVIATFMGGLAVGSRWLGGVSDRVRSPLRLFAGLEAGIALLALLSLLVPAVATPIYVRAARMLGPDQMTLHAVKLVLTLLLLLPPTILMGGTLPAVCRYFIRSNETLGSGIGWLYALNTMGAVAGCFMTAFVLIPRLGVRGSVYLAASLNGLGAVVAWLIFLRTDMAGRSGAVEEPIRAAAGRVDSEDAGITAVGEDGEMSPGFVLLCAGTMGFCALGFEVLWTRVLAFFLHSSVYAFPTMLTTFLIGSALGSLFYTVTLARTRRAAVWLGICQVLIALLALGTMGSFLRLHRVMDWFGARMGSAWLSFAVSGFVVSGVILFLPAVVMGIAFPLAVRLYAGHFGARGRAIGMGYAVNTVGSVAGSVMAGFVLIPLLGISRAMAGLALASLGLGVAILCPRRMVRSKGFAGAYGALAILAAWGLNSGLGWDSPLWINSLKLASLRAGGTCLYHKEGLGATATVVEDPPDVYESIRHRSIAVDGTVVAGTGRMLRTTQKIQAHVPLLLFKAATGRDAEYAFILGLGSGESSHSILLHPIRELDCAELVPAEVGAVHLFDDINHGILSNPRFRLHLNDARNHLLTTTRVYDVIESDAVHPDIAVNTYTREYFQIARSRLSENGVFSSWVPLFNISEDNFKIMIRTLHDVFPHVMIWYVPNDQNRHALLIGMKNRPRIDLPQLTDAFAQEEIRSSLAIVDVMDVYAVLGGLTADEGTLGPLVEGSPVNSDNNPHLAYGIPRQDQKGEATIGAILGFLTRAGITAEAHVVNSGDPVRLKSTLRMRRFARETAMRGVAATVGRDWARAVREFQSSLAGAPGDPALIRLLRDARFMQQLTAGMNHLRERRWEPAEAALRKAVETNGRSASALNGLGLACIGLGRTEEAESHFGRAIELAPSFSEARFNLAYLYYRMGKEDRAREEFEAGIRFAPNHRDAQRLAREMGLRPSPR